MHRKLFISSLLIVSLLLEFQSGVATVEYVETSTVYGPIRGVVTGTGTEKIYSYWGVPFAKPPTGTRRFRPPEPPDSWTVIRDALQPSRDCMQQPSFGVPPNFSEDCLYLNVFTPSISSNNTLLPVMVWIFGGGFIVGSATPYDTTALVRKGVVAVTLNYRLDVFGFLSTEDDTVPGNFGLLDQILALKWVKENIVRFGGDPDHVTVFGESAGACSVSLLSISPLARGLFKRVIMESGSALSPWCISYPTTNMHPKTVATLIGSKVNCSSQDSQVLLDCLQKVNAEVLINASVDAQMETLQGNITEVLRPRVERTFGVLPDLPETLIARGHFDHVDAIRGFNSNEARIIKPVYTSGATRQEFKELVRDKFALFEFHGKDSYVNALEQLYLGNISEPIEILQKTVQVSSDLSFILPAIMETELAVEALPERKQYLYEFNYRKSISTLPPWATAEHTDELPFVFHIFKLPFWNPPLPATPDDLKVSDELITMWTNFAKTGDPSSASTTWTPFSISQRNLLKISTNSTLKVTGNSLALNIYKRLLKSLENSLDSVVVG